MIRLSRTRLVTVYDARVLYPSLICNLLMYLGTERLVSVRWTAAIHDEWTRNLLEARPDLPPERLARTRRSMETALPDAEADGFEHLITGLSLPDPDDRHMLAAAIHAGAELIVTQNLKHFPAGALTPHGLEARTPDALPRRLLDAESTATRVASAHLPTVHWLPRRHRRDVARGGAGADPVLCAGARTRSPKTRLRSEGEVRHSQGMLRVGRLSQPPGIVRVFRRSEPVRHPR